MKKKYLAAPGPTPVPAEALAAMSLPVIHHRTSEYRAIFKDVREGLREVFCTKNEVLVFTSSGTGAMEGAVANLLSAGDRAVVVRGGKFGERWGELCEAYGVEYVAVDVEWGTAVDPAALEAVVDENPDVKAVFTTLCETSTGVVSDMEAIGKAFRSRPQVLVVDAISGVGAIRLETDEWGVDVVVSGSQKGLMIPPGLAFASLSEKAWKLVKKSGLPKYYFDFQKALKSQEKSDSAYTPAISLVIGLREALRLMREEGMDAVLARHGILADATRAAVRALGLELVAPESPANAVTAVKVPEGIDGQEMVKRLREDYGITMAGGQNQLKGKIFRIAHLGYADRFDVITAIAAVEMVLAELGHKVKAGKGVAAAEAVLAGL